MQASTRREEDRRRSASQCARTPKCVRVRGGLVGWVGGWARAGGRVGVLAGRAWVGGRAVVRCIGWVVAQCLEQQNRCDITGEYHMLDCQAVRPVLEIWSSQHLLKRVDLAPRTRLLRVGCISVQ